jgi:hypothetical protein
MELGNKDEKSLDGFNKTESHVLAGLRFILIKSISKVGRSGTTSPNTPLRKETG